MSDRVNTKLQEAIQTMRNFCDDAERVVKDTYRSDANKVGQVLHNLAWGFANASSSVECANSQVEHDNERKVIELEDALLDSERQF